jgi:hypothetical protein
MTHSDDAEEAQAERTDFLVRVVVLTIIIVGVAGLALASYGFWTGEGWAVVGGYVLAAPLMLVYPAIMITILAGNLLEHWRKR